MHRIAVTEGVTRTLCRSAMTQNEVVEGWNRVLQRLQLLFYDDSWPRTFIID